MLKNCFSKRILNSEKTSDEPNLMCQSRLKKCKSFLARLSLLAIRHGNDVR